MPMKSCLGCMPPDRHLYCHSTCEKYQAERKALDAVNAKRLAEITAINDAKSVLIGKKRRQI